MRVSQDEWASGALACCWLRDSCACHYIKVLSRKLDVFAGMLRLHFEQGKDPQLQSARGGPQRARTASHHFLWVAVSTSDPRPNQGLNLVNGLHGCTGRLHNENMGVAQNAWEPFDEPPDAHTAPWSAGYETFLAAGTREHLAPVPCYMSSC